METVKFHLRFPGQVYDDLTKQHYNLNRYYNSELGRYMEADPIGLEGGLNPYAYVGSNPVNAVDPMGLSVMINGQYLYGTHDISDPNRNSRLQPLPATPAPTYKAPSASPVRQSSSTSSSAQLPYGQLNDQGLSSVDAQGTRQTGLNISGNLALGLGVGGSFGFGIASDDFGNFSLYGNWSGNVVTGTPGFAMGVSNNISNAYSITDLRGFGYSTSIGGGLGPHGSVDYFTAASDHGTVFGGGATFGLGVGLGASMGGGKTYLSPSINLNKISNYILGVKNEK